MINIFTLDGVVLSNGKPKVQSGSPVSTDLKYKSIGVIASIIGSVNFELYLHEPFFHIFSSTIVSRN